MSVPPVPLDQLYQITDPNQLEFETTTQVDELTEIIGQPRAVEAVRFGTGMQSGGYNIYALGPSGTGKRTLVTKHFQASADEETIPPDWCYVYNFDQDHKPKTIQLPPGMGTKFQSDMDQFVEELRSALSSAFESDEYRTRRRMVESEIEERQEAAFEDLQGKAKQDNFALLRTPAGLVFAPVKEGEVIPPDDFNQLPDELRQEMEKQVELQRREFVSLEKRHKEALQEFGENRHRLDELVAHVEVLSQDLENAGKKQPMKIAKPLGLVARWNAYDEQEEIIKAGGFRISSKEVEEALLEHEDIHEAAVVGVADEIFGEAIKAFVVPREGVVIQIDLMKKHLSGLLPAYKHPKHFEIRTSLPKNQSGKIMKAMLSDL